MLPDDTRRRKEAALDKSVKTLQSSVTDHFKLESEAEKPIAPHSDEAFVDAAIEWLIDGGLVNMPLSYF
jgi:hypothetical protein